MPKAYSYVRFSRPEQMRGDSLRRQLEGAQKWAAERGVQLDDALQDLGVSAFRGKNRAEGALRRFLDLVESGQVERGSYLIVESLDRLSREAVLEALPRFLDLIRAGVVIVTLADRQEYSAERLGNDWTPLILSLAVMARAHEESQTKSVRVREAWDKKRERAAERPLTARVPEWVRLVNGRIEPIPERAAVIRRVFEMAANGYGKGSIASALNREGVPAFRSRSGWHPSYVAKVLDGRAVLGDYQPHRFAEGRRVPVGEPVAGYYPAVVSEDLYWRAQAARKRRASAPGRRGTEVKNLLQGLARCMICGGSMHLVDKGRPPKGGRYLRCYAAARDAGCSNRRLWRYETVEGALIDRLVTLDVAGLLVGEDRRAAGAARAEGLAAALAQAKARQRKWADMIDDGDELAAERYRAATAEVRRLRQQLAEARVARAEDEAEGSIESRVEALRKLRAALAEAGPEDRRDLRLRLAEELRRLLVQVDFGAASVTAEYRGPGPSLGRPGLHLPRVIDVVRPATAGDAEPDEPDEGERELAAAQLARLRRRKSA